MIIDVIDVGMGNIKSVVQAFKKLGHEVNFVSTPEEVRAANALVLPGVGAYADGMKRLAEHNLIEALREAARAKTPLLGICLGMQLFMNSSEEFGHTQGLGLIPGTVEPFADQAHDDTPNYRVPHIGWNTLHMKNECFLFTGLPENVDTYFVHSFIVQPELPETIITTTTYGGQEFCSTIQYGSVLGCQYHPEKSAEHGLTLLKNFCEYAERTQQ